MVCQCNGRQYLPELRRSSSDTVTPANTIMFIWDWVLRLPRNHAALDNFNPMLPADAPSEQETSEEGPSDAERRNIAVRELEASFDLNVVGAGSREAAVDRLLNSSSHPAQGINTYYDVDMCAIVFLGLLLFARFQHHPEQLPGCVAPGLPNMSARKSWYDLPLFSHRNQPAVSLKYDAQAKSMRSALEECGIHTSAVTHINRKWGAQLAERGGTYYLPRDIQRGEALLVKVFPDIERCQQQLHDSKRTEKGMAGEAFIQFMLFLRRAFLQDAPISDTSTLISTSGTTLSSKIPST
ncbi:hypothetical protein I312_104203 [Cryptococcus bacillisporus CA1280]|uniref:uncharacterized protein n=1 Tax=Cryptococcus bacillisporus CA1280 TaxID=1296109 RepID=UPI003366EF63